MAPERAAIIDCANGCHSRTGYRSITDVEARGALDRRATLGVSTTGAADLMRAVPGASPL